AALPQVFLVQRVPHHFALRNFVRTRLPPIGPPRCEPGVGRGVKLATPGLLPAPRPRRPGRAAREAHLGRRSRRAPLLSCRWGPAEGTKLAVCVERRSSPSRTGSREWKCGRRTNRGRYWRKSNMEENASKQGEENTPPSADRPARERR